MGKFVKSVIEKSKAAKNALKIKTMFKGKQGLYTFYSIWFSTIDAYASGEPSWVMRQAWKTYVIPFIPGDWVCDDKNFVGVKAKRRCKLIQYKLNKTGKISSVDKKWVKNDLKSAFKSDFRKKNLDIDKLGGMDEKAISKKLVKSKKESKFKERLK